MEAFEVSARLNAKGWLGCIDDVCQGQSQKSGPCLCLSSLPGEKGKEGGDIRFLFRLMRYLAVGWEREHRRVPVCRGSQQLPPMVLWNPNLWPNAVEQADVRYGRWVVSGDLGMLAGKTRKGDGSKEMDGSSRAGFEPQGQILVGSLLRTGYEKGSVLKALGFMGSMRIIS